MGVTTFTHAVVWNGDDTCRIGPGQALYLTRSDLEAHTAAYARNPGLYKDGKYAIVELPTPVAVEIPDLPDTPGG